MKRLIAIILALFVFGCPTIAEAATLRFSSFSGGGYEYAVKVDDPSVVSYETRHEYDDQELPVPGASYDVIVSFTGLKPGSTRAAIYESSPIMEDVNSVYAIDVDDALNVTLTPVRTISTFYLYRMIEGGVASYRIAMDAGSYWMTVNEGEACLFSADAVDELMEAIDACDIASWDGFSESDYNVLDGENFRLEIGFTDGTHVLARGDNAFPDNYDEAMEQIWRILTWNTGDENNMKMFIGETKVPVTWENNASVKALLGLLPLTIQMSMYGGFEQVGPIGVSLPRNDESGRAHV